MRAEAREEEREVRDETDSEFVTVVELSDDGRICVCRRAGSAYPCGTIG